MPRHVESLAQTHDLGDTDTAVNASMSGGESPRTPNPTTIDTSAIPSANPPSIIPHKGSGGAEPVQAPSLAPIRDNDSVKNSRRIKR
ncbi:MAG TPA: hypothetical protein VK796_11950, partial [Cytophaga sp.]|nr:hypothetical protein [Cytophaga sp.]